MLKLKRFKEAVRIEYPNAVGVWLSIRPVTFTQSMDILSEVKEKKVMIDYPIDPKDPSKKGPQVIDDYKDGAFLWKMFDQALLAWEGIEVELDEGETPLGPAEMKRVMFNNTQLREFVFSKARELADGEVKKMEEEKKN
jgi:hypothetical protein